MRSCVLLSSPLPSSISSMDKRRRRRRNEVQVGDVVRAILLLLLLFLVLLVCLLCLNLDQGPAERARTRTHAGPAQSSRRWQPPQSLCRSHVLGATAVGGRSRHCGGDTLLTKRRDERSAEAVHHLPFRESLPQLQQVRKERGFTDLCCPTVANVIFSLLRHSGLVGWLTFLMNE